MVTRIGDWSWMEFLLHIVYCILDSGEEKMLMRQFLKRSGAVSALSRGGARSKSSVSVFDYETITKGSKSLPTSYQITFMHCIALFCIVHRSVVNVHMSSSPCHYLCPWFIFPSSFLPSQTILEDHRCCRACIWSPRQGAITKHFHLSSQSSLVHLIILPLHITG